VDLRLSHLNCALGARGRGDMNQLDWMKAKLLMLPFDGGATQVYLLSLSKDDLAHVLKVIAKKVSEPRVKVISSDLLDRSIGLSEILQNKAMIPEMAKGQSTIATKMFNVADVTFDIWSEERTKTFDLEVWFWADQFFLGEDATDLKRFNELLSILSNIVMKKPYKCILTPNEASDPLEDLRKGYGIEIKLESA